MWVTWRRGAAVVLLAVTCAGGDDVQAQSRAQLRIVAMLGHRFPAYRLLGRDDFRPEYRNDFRDGRRGTLITGRFDYDAFQDFAALLIGREASPTKKASYEGLFVVCFGSQSGEYRCTETPGQDVSPPLESYLMKVPAGIHNCRGESEDRKIRTTIDSIGWIYGEKSSMFETVTRDGRGDECFLSD
jgi:hypothetical protein